MVELEFTMSIKSVRAAKPHTCDYCHAVIRKGSTYTKVSSRKLKAERFPVTKRICDKHDPKLLPLSILMSRSGK